MHNKKIQRLLGISIRPAESKTPKIQKIFHYSYASYCESGVFQSDAQKKAAHNIMWCKTGRLGYSASICTECGHTQIHNNSCRNRNCPCCQAVLKEIWVDQRSAEVIDAPYFHVVFTLPHELNPLLYNNQKTLYSLLHKCCAETLLELSADKKYLGAVPGIIQVLHTWDQELKYHVHIHCIVSGGGLTPDHKLRKARNKFFIPVAVLRDKFKGKFMSRLDACYEKAQLLFPGSCQKYRNSYEWKELKNSLYKKDWCPYIKETFNGFGNAIEYLGRYTHKTAISNSRILSVSETETVFSARGRNPGDSKREISIGNAEFIHRFLMHVLPKGFQRIRYYGFLNNRMKKKNLKAILKLQGQQKFKAKLTGLSMAELLKAVWCIDVSICPACGRHSMKLLGRIYVPDE